MNRHISIFFILVVILSFFGCSKGEEPNIQAEKDRITSYIDSFNEDEAQFDDEHYTKSGVYRLFFEYGKTEGETISKTIEKGDSLEYWFIAELFSSKPDGVFYTNVPEVIRDLRRQGSNTSYWDDTVKKAKHGATPMIEGLAGGLEGCIEGDSVMLLITSDKAYGSRETAGLPKNSTISFNIRITKVTKAE